MVYDDCSDVTFIWDEDDVEKFLDLQKTPDVTERRGVRQKMRALSQSGGGFEWPFSKMETERFPDGYRTVTDSEGNSSQEQM